MITASYNAYCAITKGGDNDIWTVRPRGVVLLLPLCSQIDVRATMNALLGDTFSRENNTHGSRFHDQDPHFASRILGAMTQSCYIGTRDIRSRVIRGLYCTYYSSIMRINIFIDKMLNRNHITDHDTNQGFCHQDSPNFFPKLLKISFDCNFKYKNHIDGLV